MLVDPNGMAAQDPFMNLFRFLRFIFSAGSSEELAKARPIPQAPRKPLTSEQRHAILAEFDRNMEIMAVVMPVTLDAVNHHADSQTSTETVETGEFAVFEGAAKQWSFASEPASVRTNAANGEAWASEVAAGMEAEGWTVSREVTLETSQGVKTRMDIVGTKPGSSPRLVEAKASAKAPHTKNQKVAHPQIKAGGAVVKGAGKPGIPGGTVLKPTEVEVVRPKPKVNPNPK